MPAQLLTPLSFLLFSFDYFFSFRVASFVASFVETVILPSHTYLYTSAHRAHTDVQAVVAASNVLLVVAIAWIEPIQV